MARTPREPASWCLAERLVAAGAVAMLFPGQAPAATATDRNLVVWRWNGATGARVRVIDEKHRLGDSPWAERRLLHSEWYPRRTPC